VKVLGVGVIKLISNFRHGLATAQQQVVGFFQPLGLHKLTDAAPEELPKATLQAEYSVFPGRGLLPRYLGNKYASCFCASHLDHLSQ
jgi:hypothetical protein